MSGPGEYLLDKMAEEAKAESDRCAGDDFKQCTLDSVCDKHRGGGARAFEEKFGVPLHPLCSVRRLAQSASDMAEDLDKVYASFEECLRGHNDTIALLHAEREKCAALAEALEQEKRNVAEWSDAHASLSAKYARLNTDCENCSAAAGAGWLLFTLMFLGAMIFFLCRA